MLHNGQMRFSSTFQMIVFTFPFVHFGNRLFVFVRVLTKKWFQALFSTWLLLCCGLWVLLANTSGSARQDGMRAWLLTCSEIKSTDLFDTVRYSPWTSIYCLHYSYISHWSTGCAVTLRFPRENQTQALRVEGWLDYGTRASFTDASALPRLLGEPRRRNVIRVIPGVYESPVGTISGVSLCPVWTDYLTCFVHFYLVCLTPI